jgi:hypothetical protein
LDAEEYTVGVFTLQDRMDFADMPWYAMSKWLMAIGDHHKVHELYPCVPGGTHREAPVRSEFYLA